MTRHLPRALVLALVALLVGDAARAEGPPLEGGGKPRLQKRRPGADQKVTPKAAAPTAAPAPAPDPAPPPAPAPPPFGAPVTPGNTPAPGTPPSDLLPGEHVATECPKFNPSKRYKWDQKGEIDLASLLAWAQATFCQTIIVPANLRQQKITIYAPTMLTPSIRGFVRIPKRVLPGDRPRLLVDEWLRVSARAAR